MLNPVTRPNFFPGQMIDYKDFNRLASHTDKTLSLICKQLFPEGGIVSEALEGFQIVPLKNLTVLVRPGAAFLPSGEMLISSKEMVIDLKEFASKASRLIIVSLKNQIQGKDKYEDAADSSITGYKSEVFEPAFSISSKKPCTDGIEIFRVNLSADTERLRVASEAEQWINNLPDGDGGKCAILDLRHRRMLLPQTNQLGNAQTLIEVRTALDGLRDSVSTLENIYVYHDKLHTSEAITQLHAEFLSLPYQPARTAYLAGECARRLSLYLERLERHVGHQTEELDREGLLNVIGQLEKLRNAALVPGSFDVGVLLGVASSLKAVVAFGAQRINLVSTLQEGLSDIADYCFSFAPKVSLAGRLFKRVDYLVATDEKRVRVKSEQAQLRKLNASFRGGDTYSAKGIFIREGTFTLYLNNIEPEKPLVLLSRRYVRRAGCRIHYELNGKPLQTEQETVSSNANVTKVNCWVNKGLVAAAETLVPQGNCLKIRVEKSDLDFGFFDLALYQPLSEGESVNTVQQEKAYVSAQA